MLECGMEWGLEEWHEWVLSSKWIIALAVKWDCGVLTARIVSTILGIYYLYMA